MYTPNKVMATGLVSLAFAGAEQGVAIGQDQPIPSGYETYCNEQPGTHPGWATNPAGQPYIDCLPDDPNQKPVDPYQDNQQEPQGLNAFYRNPLRGIPDLTRDRVDMGVDYKGTGYVYALGEGRVTRVDKGTSRFWGRELGNVVVYKLSEGPAKDKSVYVAENCVPKVKIHQFVHSYTKLCYMRKHFPYMEMGWAKGKGSDRPVASSYYHEGQRTAHGDNFNKFMVKLGAPSGTVGGRHIVGHVARSYRMIAQS